MHSNIMKSATIMKSTMMLLALSASLCTITGCGSDSDKDAGVERATRPEAVISEFSVMGTSSAQQDFIPINASVEDGKFTVNWNITSANSFHLKLFLSHDATKSVDDVRIFDNAFCGAIRVNDCFAQDQYECHFNTDNTMTCSDGWETFDENLNTMGFLTSLPQQAYIIGEACVVSDCKDAAVKVEFQ